MIRSVIIKNFTALLALLLLMACGSSNGISSNSALSNEREIININEDWQYLERNFSDPTQLMGADEWQDINLPHTWNQWDAVDQVPGYRRDASWYKKSLVINKEDQAHYILFFEGANISTDVYVNGQLAGQHVGGYVGFEVDITKYLNKSDSNELAVRVDNRYNPNVIPSQKADFFIYGGIVRDVWLKKLPNTYISKVLAATPKVTKDVANTTATIKLNKACQDCELVVSLIGSENDKAIQRKKVKVSDTEVEIVLDPLLNPQLWSPNSPNLYSLAVELVSDGKVIDTQAETIGYRYFEFDDHGPFYMNGERLILRGTHRHEEHAGYGAAMPNALHREDVKMMKDMGVNFLRLGHYPQDPEVYKACNELGIIVWDELPWCRGGMGGTEWKANTKRLLKEQITQNYNHPSILFWSLGNEIYWLPDFEGGDDRDKMNQFLTELNDMSHELDPQRMTAIRKYYDGAHLVDVFSPSIWSGWYAGVYTNYQETVEKNQKKYKRFLHMEYGGSSHVGRHTETPITGAGNVKADEWEEVSNQVNIKNIAKNGDWTENYIVDLFDWHLRVSELNQDFTGNAQWAFKDFGTPLRPENAIPYINQKGLVDRAGKPKDAYYVFKSYWSDEPMVYIESETWTHRMGPKDTSRELSVYSSCDQVELFHNGKSLGKKTKDISQFPASGLTWSLLFEEGENQLVAKGYNDNIEVAKDDLIVQYTYHKPEQPDHIYISHEKLENGNYMIHATVRDADNNRILDYEDRVYFAVDGSGSFLKHYGTPTRSDIIEMANGHAACELVPGENKAYIEVRNQSFKGSYHVIDFKSDSQNK